ncbi:hypothetical protein G9464_20715 [Halostella sp. JP-L12]|uniref:hypothetical protein n=1 Tax=Halostella TaxID=1843185 RepID=UPI000EF78757|nr:MULTISPECIES: hypothetical protein [Halostella]NHN49995.1 hypothetical protein [Halostella sp. JP-L12]
MATTQTTDLVVRGDRTFRNARRVHRDAIDVGEYENTASDEERFYLVELHETDVQQRHADWETEYVAIYASADGGRAVREHVAPEDPLPHAIAVPVGEGTVLDAQTTRRYHGIVATAHENDGWRVRETITNLVREVLR